MVVAMTKRVRQVRVDEALWDRFGTVAEATGTDRSKVLVAFIERYVAAFPAGQSAGVDQGEGPQDSTA